MHSAVTLSRALCPWVVLAILLVLPVLSENIFCLKQGDILRAEFEIKKSPEYSHRGFFLLKDYFRASFKAFPALNFGTLTAGILIF